MQLLISYVIIGIVIFYFIFLMITALLSQFYFQGIYTISIESQNYVVNNTLIKHIRSKSEFFIFFFLGTLLTYQYFRYNLGFIILFLGLLAFFIFCKKVINLKINKNNFFNRFHRSIKIENIGILVNDELLLYPTDKNITIDIRELPTSREIYYGFYISSIYNSIEFLKPVPAYQYKEIENTLVDFFSNNGFEVRIKRIRN